MLKLPKIKIKIKIKTGIIDDDQLLENYKTIWTKIEDLKYIQLDASTVCDDRYIKTKINTNFRSLDVPADSVECESFTVTSTESHLLV